MGSPIPFRRKLPVTTAHCLYMALFLMLQFLQGVSWSNLWGISCMDTFSFIFLHPSSTIPRTSYSYCDGRWVCSQGLLLWLHTVVFFHSSVSFKFLYLSLCRSDPEPTSVLVVKLICVSQRGQNTVLLIYHPFRLTDAFQSPHLFLKLGHQTYLSGNISHRCAC